MDRTDESHLNRGWAILQLGFYYFLADMRKRRLGIFALMLEPIGTFIIYYFLLYILMDARSEQTLWHFLSGIFIMTAMRAVSNEVAEARSKGIGITSVSSIPLLDIISIRTIVGVLNGCILLAVLCVILAIFGRLDLNFMLPVHAIYLWILGFSLGLVFLSLKAFFSDIDILIGMFFRVVFLTSGILFSADTISPGILKFVIHNPFLIVFAEMRGSITGDPGFSGYNEYLPLALAAVALVAGVSMFNAFRVRLRNTR